MTTRGKIRYDIEAKTASFTSAMNKVDNRLKGMQNSLKGIAGIAAGAFAVDRIAEFGKELFLLAENGVEVRNAFQRLNDAKLLDNLRTATQGAVSDLELMKKAVSANNLGVPLKNMAVLFEFATKRASETGESVDMLVDSIVTGIGRKSSLVLDNLGIVMSTAGKTVGEVADQVTNLAEKSLVEMGNVGVNTSDKLIASFNNFKETLGIIVSGPGNDFLKWLDDIVLKANAFILGTTLENLEHDIDRARKAFERLSKSQKATIAEVDEAMTKVGLLEDQRNRLLGTTAAEQARGQSPTTAQAGMNFNQPQLEGLSLAFDFLEKIDTTQADIIKGALEQQEAWKYNEEILQESLKLMGEMSDEKIVDLRNVTSEVNQGTMNWQKSLMGVQGVLGIINATLGLTGDKMSGLSKVLKFLMVGLNIASSVASVAAMFNPISATTQTIEQAFGSMGGHGGGGVLRGQDIVGSVNATNAIGSSLGVTSGR